MALDVPLPELFVHTQVVDRLRRLRAGPREVGGWLLGYWMANERQIVVTHATPPGPKGSIGGVRISGRGHRARFDEAWTASAGDVTFLGDWHTHPGGPVVPSDRDKRALTKLARGPDYGTPRPLMAIAGTPRWPWRRGSAHLECYLRRESGVANRLEPIVVNELPPSAAAVPTWRWPRTRGQAPWASCESTGH